MHTDLIDQVNWAVAKGIADKARIGILGGSYGGYATLIGMTKTPEVFACGMDVVGPSDIAQFLPIWWENYIPADNMAYKTRVLGDPATKAGRAQLRESSPITFAGQAKNPLLVIQGAMDSRVPRDQSDNIVNAFKKYNVPVTYFLYPDEGHGVSRPENIPSFLAAVEVFFGHNLKGRYDPIGDRLQKASVQVLEGADLLPGLHKALTDKNKK